MSISFLILQTAVQTIPSPGGANAGQAEERAKSYELQVERVSVRNT